MKIQLFNKTVSVIAVLLLVITQVAPAGLAAVAPEDELQSRSVPGAEKQVSEDVRPEVFSAVEVRQNFGTTQDFFVHDSPLSKVESVTKASLPESNLGASVGSNDQLRARDLSGLIAVNSEPSETRNGVDLGVDDSATLDGKEYKTMIDQDGKLTLNEAETIPSEVQATAEQVASAQILLGDEVAYGIESNVCENFSCSGRVDFFDANGGLVGYATVAPGGDFWIGDWYRGDRQVARIVGGHWELYFYREDGSRITVPGISLFLRGRMVDGSLVVRDPSLLATDKSELEVIDATYSPSWRRHPDFSVSARIFEMPLTKDEFEVIFNSVVDLDARLGGVSGRITIVGASQEEWSNGCLGWETGSFCGMRQEQGYSLTLRVSRFVSPQIDVDFVYHSGLHNRVVLDPHMRAILDQVSEIPSEEKLEEIQKTIEGKQIPPAVQTFVDALQEAVGSVYKVGAVLQDGKWLIAVNFKRYEGCVSGGACPKPKVIFFPKPGQLTHMSFSISAEGKPDIGTLTVTYNVLEISREDAMNGMSQPEVDAQLLYEALVQRVPWIDPSIRMEVRDDVLDNISDRFVLRDSESDLEMIDQALIAMTRISVTSVDPDGAIHFTRDEFGYKTFRNLDGAVKVVREWSTLSDGTTQFFDETGRIVRETRPDGSKVLYSYEGDGAMLSAVTFVRPDGKEVRVEMERSEKIRSSVSVFDALAIEQAVIDLLGRGEDVSNLVLKNFLSGPTMYSMDIPRSFASTPIKFDLVSLEFVYSYKIQHVMSERSGTATYTISIFTKTPVVPSAVQAYTNELKKQIGDGFEVTIERQEDRKYRLRIVDVKDYEQPPVGGLKGLEVTLDFSFKYIGSLGSDDLKLNFGDLNLQLPDRPVRPIDPIDVARFPRDPNFGFRKGEPFVISGITATYYGMPEGQEFDSQLLYEAMGVCPEGQKCDAMTDVERLSRMTQVTINRVEDGVIYFTRDGVDYKTYRDRGGVVHSVQVVDSPLGKTLQGASALLASAVRFIEMSAYENPQAQQKTFSELGQQIKQVEILIREAKQLVRNSDKAMYWQINNFWKVFESDLALAKVWDQRGKSFQQTIKALEKGRVLLEELLAPVLVR